MGQFFAHNPVARRLIDPARWPSPRLSLRLACGMALAGVAAGAWMSRILSAERFVVESALVTLALILAWPTVSFAAATLTVEDIQGSKLDLVLLTNLSKTTLIQGYICAALYRLRVLFMLLLGLTGVVLGDLLLEAFAPTDLSILMAPYLPEMAVLVALILPNLWAMIPAAAAWGVALGFRWQSPVAAAILAPVSVIAFAACAGMNWLFFGFWLASTLAWLVNCLILSASFVLFVPYIAWRYAVDIARRRVRRT